jgi:hypothetical protein
MFVVTENIMKHPVFHLCLNFKYDFNYNSYLFNGNNMCKYSTIYI